MKMMMNSQACAEILSVAMLASLLSAGCAANKSSTSSNSNTLQIGDLMPVWQNATPATSPGATVPSTATPQPPPPPPTTLGSAATTVGGSVSTQPGNPTYDVGWPRIFFMNDSTNTLYEPQVESLTGMLLKARAAVSIQSSGMKEPTFGILHIQALAHVDRIERLVHFEDIQITDAVFPSASAQKASYTATWLSLLKEHVQSMALDRVTSDLLLNKAEQQAKAVPILNPVPKFIFSTTPAMLIHVQGPPDFRAMPGSSVERLMNTRAFIAKASSGALYLHLWDGFVTAPSLSGEWSVAGQVPAEVSSAEQLAVKEKSVDLLGGQPNPETGKRPLLASTPLPKIYLETEPAELIVFEGAANWLPVAGTDLLYVTNTVANVFKYLGDQQTYVLVSGRWFRAASFAGPWTFVSGKELPAEFAKIPSTSPKENVLASVPGTSQSKQALIENDIPQMARVDRSSTHMPAPAIDGSPQLRPIEGTSLSYVVNTATPLIEVNTNTWYSLANGVWFSGSSMYGPWTVANSVPAVIYSIPVSSPLYYVTYVRVYSYNASYVWTGYTPGFYGTAVAPDGVVIYGTGYYYSPWVGSIYVAPPLTYGYSATLAWTPWAGWGYGFAAGWAWGASWNYWCAAPCPPYWGPYYGWCGGGAYYNGYGGMTAWGPGGWAATTGNMYSQWGNWSSTWRGGAGYNAYTGRSYGYQYGHAYNSVTGTMAAGERGAVQNVYTGNYAYGGRGVAYNPKTGMSAAGSHYTVGNAYSGRQATVGHGTVYDPRTGSSTDVAGMHGSSGGVYDVGGHTFATTDGNIYRSNSSGGWDRYGGDGGWQNVQGLDQNRSLSDSFNSQNFGDQRANSWQNHGWQDSSGWGNRSWDSGGWGGGDRSWGGGGGGFGGFRGGGFGGFRR